MEAAMKSKASLILGVLVLVLSAMGVSPATAAVAPAVSAPPAPAATPFVAGASSSPSSFLCSLNQSVAAGLPKPETFTPPAVPATPPPCSSCSDFVCLTRSVNAPCGTNLYCYDFGRICHTDGQITCRCAVHIPYRQHLSGSRRASPRTRRFPNHPAQYPSGRSTSGPSR